MYRLTENIGQLIVDDAPQGSGLACTMPAGTCIAEDAKAYAAANCRTPQVKGYRTSRGLSGTCLVSGSPPQITLSNVKQYSQLELCALSKLPVCPRAQPPATPPKVFVEEDPPLMRTQIAPPSSYRPSSPEEEEEEDENSMYMVGGILALLVLGGVGYAVFKKKKKKGGKK